MQIQNKKIRILFAVLLAGMIVLIWGHSMMPATQSSAESSQLLIYINRVLSVFHIQITEHILRKLAHFSEFAVLGFLLRLNFQKHLSFSLFFGLFVALTDETIQLFFEGRSGSVTDVWIDFSGVLFATLCFCLIHMLVIQISKSGTKPASQHPQS